MPTGDAGYICGCACRSDRTIGRPTCWHLDIVDVRCRCWNFSEARDFGYELAFALHAIRQSKISRDPGPEPGKPRGPCTYLSYELLDYFSVHAQPAKSSITRRRRPIPRRKILDLN